MSTFYVYDIETYPNCFTCTTVDYTNGTMWVHELSERKNEMPMFLQLLKFIETTGGRMVGFNNVAFDYPVIHNCILNREAGQITNAAIMAEVNRLFDPETQFKSVRPSDVIIPQVDLFKIHHFDNSAKRTSLKALELFMRMDKIQDLPFIPNTNLKPREMADLVTYNIHDVKATTQFLDASVEMIAFRDQMSKEYGIDFTNFNDVKIGTEILRLQLEKRNPGCTRHKSPRSEVRLGELILGAVKLNHPAFKEVERRITETVISRKDLVDGVNFELITKGVFKDLTAVIDGFAIDFGMGGLHASVPPQIVTSDDEYAIIDLDVASYYPNIATSYGIFPEHLGPDFCEVYRDMYEIRKKYPKSNPMNKAMKLALNGSFGATNSKYSYLFDPNYTFTITINGQLLLAMFIERCIQIPSLTMIQVNTDGITVKLKRSDVDTLLLNARDWESYTGLVLEDVEYSRMFIRDVNNYIGEFTDGSVKRKGAYEYETQWHQDPSSPVIAKCAEKCLLTGEHPAMAVFTHPDIMDFMVRFKVKGGAKLVDENDKQYQKITRGLVSHDGVNMFRRSKPTGVIGTYKRKNKIPTEFFNSVLAEVGDQWDERIHTKNRSKYEIGNTAMLSGRKVKIYNDIEGPIDRSEIDFHYYITEVEKLML